LLHTLWFLLLIAWFLGITLKIGWHTAERFIIEKSQIERKWAEESALNDVLFEVLNRGFKPAAEHDYSFNGQHFRVTVIPSHGFVDLNTGQANLLRQIAQRTGINLDSLLKLRSKEGAMRPMISDYAALNAQLGLASQQFACIYPYVTLFSGRPSPLSQYMPDYLKKLLGRLHEESTSVISSDNGFTLGDSLRIEVKPHPIQPTGYYLSAEILLTGRLDTPFFIRAWQHLPQCQKEF